ncbi:MAG: GNAT family N-acetyltransferase [Acidimicrobiia bacterium]
MTGPRGPELRTERLLLRRWNDVDRIAFAALNADPAVMEHFPSTLGVEQSDAFVDRIEATFDERGYGLWAVEVPGQVAFAGFVGLWPATFPAHFTPAVEVGWRFAVAHWGQGYAPEGAAAALDYGFDVAGLDEVVSMTTVGNTKSRRVMEKLGMHRDPADDFDHPNTPGWHGQRHVLYRLSAEEWRQYRSAP